MSNQLMKCQSPIEFYIKNNLLLVFYFYIWTEKTLLSAGIELYFIFKYLIWKKY